MAGPNTCPSALFIGVRGSGETSADYGGYGATINAVFTALQAIDPSVNGVSIDYQAIGVNWWDPRYYDDRYNNSVGSGIASLLSELTGFLAVCHQSRVYLAGYSQGAQVVGDTYLGWLSDPERARITRLVLIGDPKFRGGQGAPVDDGDYNPRLNGIATISGSAHAWAGADLAKARSYCANGDPVCNFSSAGQAAGCGLHKSTCPHTRYMTNIDPSQGVTYTDAAGQFLAGPAGTGCTGSGSRHLALSPSDLAATWSGAGGDAGVNNYVAGPSPFANGHIPTLAWRCFLPARIASPISISGGHVFFLALSSPTLPARYMLYSLDESTGAVQWTRDVAAASSGSYGVAELVVAGGAAVVTTEAMTYAYDMSSGQLRWTTRLGVGQVNENVVVSDGTRIYLQAKAPSQYANPGGTISAIDASSGAVVWQAGYYGWQSGLAVGDGFVFANSGGMLMALSTATGAAAWEADFSSWGCQWAVPMALDGQLFVGISPTHGYQGGVASLDPGTGAVRWTVKGYASLAGAAPGYLLISPGSSGDATVLSASDGHTLWTGAAGDGFTATDAFVGSGGTGLSAFDPATGRLEAYVRGANFGYTAVAGSVIVGNSNVGVSNRQEVDAWQ